MAEPRRIDGHLVQSYLSLRRAIGIIGIALPFVLALGGLLLLRTPLQASISGYYHTGMRDVFVGSLCAIAVFLWSYRGYERRDNVAANVAGGSAVGVALFPTASGPGVPVVEQVIGWLHLGFAAVFFSILAYFCLVLFRLSDREQPTERKLTRNAIYRVCGYAIVAALVGIATVAATPLSAALAPLRPVFWLEAVAVLAFGISWLVKGEAILEDRGPARQSRVVPPRIPGGEDAAADRAAGRDAAHRSAR